MFWIIVRRDGFCVIFLKRQIVYHIIMIQTQIAADFFRLRCRRLESKFEFAFLAMSESEEIGSSLKYFWEICDE